MRELFGEMLRARRDVALPYLLFEATGDGAAAVQASHREAHMLGESGHCVIDGNHGGAALCRRAIGAMATHLNEFCEALLRQ